MRARGGLVLSCVLLFVACGAESTRETPAPTPVPPTPAPGPAPAPGAPAPVTVAAIDVNPSIFVGGSNARGDIDLSAAAPAGGAVVTLASSDAAATVPASTTVPEGSSSGQFAMTTRAVTADTVVTISGTAGGETRAKSIRLTPAAVATGLASLTSSSPYIGWGQTIPLTAQLSAPAPAGGLSIMLSASGSALNIPTLLTIPGGQATGSVNMTARNVEATVTVTGSGGGSTRSVPLQVVPVFIRIDSTGDDPVGQGRSYRIEPGTFVFGGDLQFNNVLELSAQASPNNWWSVGMAPPSGRPLVPGVYKDARRIPPIGSSLPTLRIAGEGRGCNQSTGEFEVLEAVYGPGFGGIVGSVEKFRATFKQTCEGFTGSLSGEIRLATIPYYCKISRNC